MDNNHQYINIKTLNELRDILGDGLSAIIDEYYSDAREHISKIQSCLDSDQREELSRAAHTLKGSSSNIGMALLSKQCQILETTATNSTSEELRKIIVTLLKDLDASINELRAQGF